MYHLVASHSKSLEFLLVPLTHDGRINFKALTVFSFFKIKSLKATCGIFGFFPFVDLAWATKKRFTWHGCNDLDSTEGE